MREQGFFRMPALFRPAVDGIDGIGKVMAYASILFMIAIKLGFTDPNNWSPRMVIQLLGGAAVLGAGIGLGNAIANRR
ncbi:MAG TPA: hypothetical protein VGV92_02945 [Gammaproteobacteria bacterium]|nr:hypothetical protein [Gammaproteobacteria bacterium]